MSRPEKPIDWRKVDHLLMAGCKGTEIAPHFDLNVETFYDRVVKEYGIGFTEYSCLKRSHGDSLIKVKQYEKALKGDGDNTQLIWLGKQRLDQRDRFAEVKEEAPKAEELEMKKNLYAALYQIEQLQKELNALKPKTSEIIHGSDTPLQSLDRGSEQRQDLCEPGQVSRENS